MTLVLRRFDAAAPTKAQLRAFSCGYDSLDGWLATQARQSLASRDAVTYLLLDEAQQPATIAGYFALSAAQVRRAEAPNQLYRRALEPIPCVRMGRFALDLAYQGQGLAADLLREALVSALAAGEVLGARLLLVDAIDETALGFYLHHGFEPSPVQPLQAMIDLSSVAASLPKD